MIYLLLINIFNAEFTYMASLTRYCNSKVHLRVIQSLDRVKYLIIYYITVSPMISLVKTMGALS